MDHPAVAQVVTFACRTPSWAKTLPPPWCCARAWTLTERELRDFRGDEALADFKVPRKILFLAEIPKGATGKLQRIGLAGVHLEPAPTAVRP
jgi:acyl-coenzyme A synthetase/AMP-(fatty) acid ligase